MLLLGRQAASLQWFQCRHRPTLSESGSKAEPGSSIGQRESQIMGLLKPSIVTRIHCLGPSRPPIGTARFWRGLFQSILDFGWENGILWNRPLQNAGFGGVCSRVSHFPNRNRGYSGTDPSKTVQNRYPGIDPQKRTKKQIREHCRVPKSGCCRVPYIHHDLPNLPFTKLAN